MHTAGRQRRLAVAKVLQAGYGTAAATCEPWWWGGGCNFCRSLQNATVCWMLAGKNGPRLFDATRLGRSYNILRV